MLDITWAEDNAASNFVSERLSFADLYEKNYNFLQIHKGWFCNFLQEYAIVKN